MAIATAPDHLPTQGGIELRGVAKALLLSDRVVVMSARPGRVVEVVDVPFARPRGEDLLTDPTFHALEDRLTHALLATQHAAA
jgi:NitT/TauT family transport system ATP-binding protein